MTVADLTVGIVGIGSIGQTHARALKEIDGVRLTCYSGGTADSGEAAGWPQARQTTHDRLIDSGDVDIVVLCSPTGLHGAAAISIAGSGRHVVVEKPMSLNVSEADELVRIQRRGTAIVSMVAQRRFEDVYAHTRRLLRDGRIGDVRLGMTVVPWWRDASYFEAAPWRTRADEGGSLVNQGVHNVDLLQWLCGDVHSVTAQSATLALPIEAEDTTAVTLRFESGAIGLIATSTATPPGFPATLTLYTSHGAVELGQGDVRRWEVPEVEPPASVGATVGGGSDPAAIGSGGHVAYWRDVIDSVRERRVPLIDAVEGAKVTRLLCGIREAAATGTAVSLADLR